MAQEGSLVFRYFVCEGKPARVRFINEINLLPHQVHRVPFIHVNGNIANGIDQIGVPFLVESEHWCRAAAATAFDPHPKAVVGRDALGLHDVKDLLTGAPADGYRTNVLEHVRNCEVKLLNFKTHFAVNKFYGRFN